ncbi:hypothetical protein [Mucilaginibacter ginkgonis]|uniref:Uncharacterized protein n=1 Tax=Mucilaginibacter ginkgonis TaxID=2682091 RepID=A0A6I4INH0_9SPHI|nr:hypothetical protein [Mucilaginibacter ginkgonis]QQL48585.1 hypothetical protein GO620_010360 [Mucilaginibacter ginkgonis]
MNPKQITNKQIAAISIICGLLGGAALITSSRLSHNGFFMIAVCVAIMQLAFIVSLTRINTEVSFKKWIIIGTLTFTIMNLVMYFYAVIFNLDVSILSFVGYLWRFAFMVGCGAVSSAVLGLFLLGRKPATLQVS